MLELSWHVTANDRTTIFGCRWSCKIQLHFFATQHRSEVSTENAAADVWFIVKPTVQHPNLPIIGYT